MGHFLNIFSSSIKIFILSLDFIIIYIYIIFFVILQLYRTEPLVMLEEPKKTGKDSFVLHVNVCKQHLYYTNIRQLITEHTVLFTRRRSRTFFQYPTSALGTGLTVPV